MIRLALGGKCGVVRMPLWDGVAAAKTREWDDVEVVPTWLAANARAGESRWARAMPPRPRPNWFRKCRRLRRAVGRGPVQSWVAAGGAVVGQGLMGLMGLMGIMGLMAISAR